jgi:hypothetical protein
MKNYIFLLFLAFCFLSCKESKIENQVEIRKLKTYKQKLPINFEFKYGKDTILSKEILIVVIDPQGNGKLAVEKMSKVIEKYNCTVIGLNDLKNNTINFEQRILNNIRSAKNNLALNIKQLYIIGFSGGARMALQFSKNNEISGVLMIGAGLPQNEIYNIKIPLALLIGTQDFNFIEQFYSYNSELVKNENIFSLYYVEKHKWATQDNIYLAVSFLLLKNGFLVDNNISKELCKKNDFYIKNKNYLLVFKNLEASFKLNNSINKDSVWQEIEKLKKNEEFLGYMKQLNIIIEEEINTNNYYIQQFAYKNFDWWKLEINNIDKKIENKKNQLLSDSYARTKSFLGMVSFSFCNKEIINENSTLIDSYLKIYETLEPNNSDMYFFKAVRYKQKGNISESKRYFELSKKNGFIDLCKAKEFGLM